MQAMRTNMVADGWLHEGVWISTVCGVLFLWLAAQGGTSLPPSRWFLGLLIAGEEQALRIVSGMGFPPLPRK
jgi:uncharacterized membrane protein